MISCSIIFPSFMTRILSASRIVERRCATMKLVRPFIIVRNAFCIRISVLVSIEEVASSRISIGGRHNMTRVIQRSCFCPCDRLPPSSVISVSYPFDSLRIKLCAWLALPLQSFLPRLHPVFPYRYSPGWFPFSATFPVIPFHNFSAGCAWSCASHHVRSPGYARNQHHKNASKINRCRFPHPVGRQWQSSVPAVHAD